MASVLAPTSFARAPATFASFPAAFAAWRAWSAEPCAAAAFLSTSAIAPSLRLVRSCVSSTLWPNESTFLLTSPTPWRTNFLVAHAGNPTATRPTSVIVDNTFDMTNPPLRGGLRRLTLGCQPLRARSIAQPLLQLPCQRGVRAEPYRKGRNWSETGSLACKFVALTV